MKIRVDHSTPCSEKSHYQQICELEHGVVFSMIFAGSTSFYTKVKLQLVEGNYVVNLSCNTVIRLENFKSNSFSNLVVYPEAEIKVNHGVVFYGPSSSK